MEAVVLWEKRNKKNTKNICADNPFSDLNPGPLKHQSAVLTSPTGIMNLIRVLSLPSLTLEHRN
jgi:hypothetical protein